MKIMKKMFCGLLVCLMCFSIVGCKKQEDPVEKDLETIKTVADMLDEKLIEFGIDKEMVDDIISDIEEFNKETKYVIAFDIKSESNSILNMTIHFPVEKEFFDSVEIGDRVIEEELKNLEYIDQSLEDLIVAVKEKIVRE